MSFALTLCLVLLAVYALASLIVSVVVALIWRAGLDRRLASSNDLLAVRLLPSAGAAFLTLTVAMPAFMAYEPPHELETVGPLLVALVVLAMAMLCDGIRRGWQASAAAAAFSRACNSVGVWTMHAAPAVNIVDTNEPIVAVIGGWRPRIVASQRVVDACSQEEFSRVVAHEIAHLSRHDNLRLLLLIVSPDPLAWFSTGAGLAARWRAAVELEADERATGADPRNRIALASALVKVARLSTVTSKPLPSLSMPVAVDDIAGRVRRLLAPPLKSQGTASIKALLMCAALIPMLAMPLCRLVHQFLEALVAFGR